MGSFYMPESDKLLAEAIAANSGGTVYERPLSNAVEVHGQRLTVTREMVKAHLKNLDVEDVGGLLERTTWEMLKRNANGKVTDTGTTLTVEGLTHPGDSIT